MGDGVGDQEVERRPAALAGHVLDDAGEAVAADEERERLVLVRRPRHQLVEEEGRRRQRQSPQPRARTRGAVTNERAETANGRGSREASTVWVIGFWGRMVAGRLAA